MYIKENNRIEKEGDCMRTLIIYATKSGTSQYCASLLARQIEDCAIFDLSKAEPDIAPFDTIIIGSGVRMGKLYRPVLNFIKKNEALLLEKRTAFYLCNAYPDTLQKTIDKNIPEQVAKAAIYINSFGGKAPFRAYNDANWLLGENVNGLIHAILSLS